PGLCNNPANPHIVSNLAQCFSAPNHTLVACVVIRCSPRLDSLSPKLLDSLRHDPMVCAVPPRSSHSRRERPIALQLERSTRRHGVAVPEDTENIAMTGPRDIMVSNQPEGSIRWRGNLNHTMRPIAPSSPNSRRALRSAIDTL